MLARAQFLDEDMEVEDRIVAAVVAGLAKADDLKPSFPEGLQGLLHAV
ncbi:MAG TPA: hypothetical protein VGN80_18975 [Devosiaceae bacterium]|nr:hypothetical protein [Devosiaceae bacterium]